MKKFVLSLTKVNYKLLAVVFGLTVFIFTSTLADEFKYADSWGKAGYTLETQSATKVVINFSIEEFFLSPIDVNGESMLHVELPGHLLPNNEGAPDLPGAGRYIAVPQGASASYKIVSYRTETLTNIDISPAPRIPWDTETEPLEYNKDESIYLANKFYPDKPVQLSELFDIRKADVVMLGITPFQYNPVTKQLVIYRDLKIEVTFSGGNSHFGENRYRSRWWDPILSDMLLNYKSLPEIDYNKSSQGLKDTGCEYLIITPNGAEFQQWADTIKKFRTLQGILTDVVTLNEIGGSTPSVIENYIDDAYNTWDIPPVACLLLADHGTNADNSIVSPTYSGFVSDNVYADVAGTGIPHIPDIVFARMTAQNATHLETMVTKFLDHERTPPTAPYYYNNPITALGFQSDRWFQICSESVAGFWEVIQDKTTTRINVGPCGSVWSTNQNTYMVLDVFGPDGLGYIPETPGQVNCSWNGTGADVVNAINSGAFMLQHRDHGGETGWSHPNFSNSNINSLNNTDLTFVWSINCLTGKFNITGECFAEKFHRHTSGGNNSGALGIIAASEVSYSFVNDTYVWGAYDNMWPDFLPDIYAPQVDPEPRGVLPSFGNAAGKYFLEQSSWPYNTNNKEVTYYLFHHHGDAFMTVYSEIPQNLTVTHNPILYAGVTSFDVTANEGSLIALTVNGEIIGTAEGTGAPFTITIPGQVPPDQMLVTITLQNYYRYEALVDVIPPTGPYVVRESYTINDNTGGNGDGLMDYGETNLLSLTVENVGVQQADDVTVVLNTTDQYVTITDNTEFYGNIAAGATAVVADGFEYEVANDIPDGHNVSFEVLATDVNDSTWVSYFTIPGHAPVLEFVDFSIADPTGNNNGKIDPGETVDITVDIENSGSSEAFNILGELTTTDPYLTVNTSSVDYGDLAGGGTAYGTFSATADMTTPAGHLVDLLFDMTADLGIEGSGEFDVVIGQIPVLILDLDGNGNSAPAMEDAIAEMEVAYEKLTSFPPDLNLYSTIFVCLGIYSQNHVLSSSEGQVLADYLNNGGNLYMEGGDTWYYDNQTSVHSMFNINATSDGSSDMGTVLGQSGTFTEGMTFNYSGDNSWMDHIAAISPAFDILENQSPNYGTGVAYDEGSYKTIGTSHEFGGLDDATFPSTKEELMNQYLNFLGITTSMQAAFISSATEICEQETVDFFDQSSGNVISWEWIFEGGTPASSTFQNPTVMYYNEGLYDVTLTVYDGVEYSTLLLEDYITVSSVPGTLPTPTGVTEVCASGGNTSYSTTGLPGITTYDWVLEPASAGTISGNGDNITIIWEDSFLGDVTLKVAGENLCGTGTYSDPLEITVYLPDVSLEAFDDVCVDWPEFALTGGMPDGGEYSGPGVSNGMFDPGVAGLGTHTITYTYEDGNGCSNYAEETIYVDPCTGIIENTGDQAIMIFPNPNNGNFTIQLNLEINELVDLTIYNALNEIVYEENNISTSKDYSKEISLNNYARGIYYLRVTGEETNLVNKIIIQQ